MKQRTLLLLLAIAFCSLLLNVYKKSSVPPSFDADEAAFGYNAYSIAKTGKDEYGSFLPLRLKSFGDYKLPLYSYLSVPFVATMGLSVDSTRALNVLLTILLPFAMFALVKEFFDKDGVALTASALAGFSWGLLSISRQAHEAYLAVFLTTLALLFFYQAH